MSNRPSAFTAQRLLQILDALPSVSGYLVGFSGGADSTALLHALCSIRDRLDVPLAAVHVNHGLHGDADQWQKRCERLCDQLDVALTSIDIKPTGKTGKGLEAEARQMRYAAITSLMAPGMGLLTAHHADDQAETLLLNLMRGSGVDGLAAMPDSRPLGQGLLQRPLLEFQRDALTKYLDQNSVEWVEDPSNQLLEHDRNLVRHEVIPLLEQRWPGVSQRLLLTRRAMSGARRLLEEMADDYLAVNLVHPQVMQTTIAARTNGELFKLAVRRWLKNSMLPSLPVYRLESLFEQVQQASGDRQVSVAWESCVLRYYQQRLWLLPDGEIAPCPTRPWPPGARELELGDSGTLVLTAGVSTNLPAGLTVENRSALDNATILQGGHHKTLKNIFQSAAVPAWLRDSVPLVCHAGEVVAVGDWCVADRFNALLSEHGLRLNWRPRTALLKFIHAQQNQR